MLTLKVAPGQAFLLRTAERDGVSRGRLDRHPEIRAPFPGVRVRVQAMPRDEPPWQTRRRTVLLLASAYRLIMPGHVFFSHFTAAEIHALPLPLPRTAREHDLTDPNLPLDGRVEASVLMPLRAPRTAHVRGHELSPAHVRVVDHGGFRVSDPASTWGMLADRLTVEDLVVLGDAAVRRARVPPTPLSHAPAPLATIEQLAAQTRRHTPGVSRLRAAFPLIRQGSSSGLESLQRLHMQRGGLPEPVLDHDVFDDDGRFLGCSEIAYPYRKVAVECEGDHHRTDRTQWNHDITKYQAYGEAGWLVVRLTGTLVRQHRAEAVRRVRAALTRRGWSPGDPA